MPWNFSTASYLPLLSTQKEAKVITACQNKPYHYLPCWDSGVYSWKPSTDEIPPNTRRNCLLPTNRTRWGAFHYWGCLNKAEKITSHYNTGWCGFTNNDYLQPILPVLDFEVQRAANTSSHHLSKNLTATLGHSPASCPREPNHKESKLDVSWRLEEKIPTLLFSYPLPALLSPPKQTASVERLCCSFWLWFASTTHWGAEAAGSSCGARAMQKGNHFGPKSHCFKGKSQPPPAARLLCPAKTEKHPNNFWAKAQSWTKTCAGGYKLSLFYL